MKNKLQTTWGTSHFVDFASALRYYQQQEFGVTVADIKNKIKEKSISIGRPEIKENQTAFINHSEGRWFIRG